MVVLPRFFVTLRFQISALFSAVRKFKQWMCQLESLAAPPKCAWLTCPQIDGTTSGNA